MVDPTGEQADCWEIPPDSPCPPGYYFMDSPAMPLCMSDDESHWDTPFVAWYNYRTQNGCQPPYNFDLRPAIEQLVSGCGEFAFALAIAGARNPGTTVGGAARTGNPYITAGAITLLIVGGFLIAVTSGTRVDTYDPDDDDENCSDAIRRWKETANTRPAVPRNPGDLAFQVAHAGTTEYEVTSGSTSIWADGIDVENCRLIDAKRIRGNPQESFRVEDSDAQQRLITAGIFDMITGRDRREIERYGIVIRASELPFRGLLIVTSHDDAHSYWQGFVDTYNVPNTSIVTR